MTKNQLPRRSLLSGMLGSIAGFYAGLVGGKAKAANVEVPTYVNGRTYMMATASKPIEPSGYEYQCLGVTADGGRYYASWPLLDFDEAIKARDSLLATAMDNSGRRLADVEIITRPLGETMQLPKP